MSFKFKVDNEKLQGIEPVPQGIYKLRLVGFNPKHAKPKQGSDISESVNFNPEFEIVAPGTKYDGRSLKYAFSANTKIPNWIQDMVHGLGMEMEGYDPNNPESEASIPGIWDADAAKFNRQDASTWTYQGPLLNKECNAELYITEYNGRKNNSILRFICAVPKCNERFPKIQHSDKMVFSK
jgi:hypothetical protein